MGIFRRRHEEPFFGELLRGAATATVPAADLAAARPVVAGLVARDATDAEVRGAIRTFVAASGTPPLHERLEAMRTDPEIHERPWHWLVDVCEQALEAGDAGTVCLAAYFSVRFNYLHAPRLSLTDFVDLGLDPAPEETQERLAELGRQAARSVPPDHVVAGSPPDALTAGMVAQLL